MFQSKIYPRWGDKLKWPRKVKRRVRWTFDSSLDMPNESSSIRPSRTFIAQDRRKYRTFSLLFFASGRREDARATREHEDRLSFPLSTLLGSIDSQKTKKEEEKKKETRRAFTFSTATLWLFNRDWNMTHYFLSYNVFHYFCRCLMLRSQSYKSNLR